MPVKVAMERMTFPRVIPHVCLLIRLPGVLILHIDIGRDASNEIGTHLHCFLPK